MTCDDNDGDGQIPFEGGFRLAFLEVWRSGVRNDRVEEEDTNPICFRLYSISDSDGLNKRRVGIDIPSNVEPIQGPLNI